MPSTELIARGCALAGYSVAQVDHAIREPVLVERFERDANVVRERRFAATDNDRVQEQVDLVDEAGPELLAPPGRGRRC